MILIRSNLIKFTSLTFLVIALVLITIILAESPNLKDVDIKLLPNNANKKSVPKSSRQTNSTIEPATAQQYPNFVGNNQPQNTPNYPNTLINLLAPTLLPGLGSPGLNPSALNSAEQQLTPYQLRNASPLQLQRFRQLQEMQQLQRQRGGPGLTDIIGALLPVGPNSLLAQNQANANGYPNNPNTNQNPATLAQLLGLAPQRNNAALSGLTNPYANQNNALNNAQLQNQKNGLNQPNANLRVSNDNTANNSGDNSANSANNEDNGENSEGDNSGENNGEEEGNDDQNQSNQQPDPSQDPDIQQFNNLQGNENFPGDLFPAGILSENDLKDIQKSMEEQAKKEAEKQRNQEGNGGEEEGNAEDDSTNGNDQSEGDQSEGDQSSDEETNANQTDDNQDNSNAETDSKNTNNGKLSTADVTNDDKKNSGYIVNDEVTTTESALNIPPKKELANNKPTNSYSYNNLKPNRFKPVNNLRPKNNYANINSNVQYTNEDDSGLNNNIGGQSYRPMNYNRLNGMNRPSSSLGGTLGNRNYLNNQRQRNPPDDENGVYRPNYRSRINEINGPTRFNEPYNNNNYGSQVDYSPDNNLDRLNQDNPYNTQDYNSMNNPMNNYRPNDLLSRHLNRQQGNLRERNYVNNLNDGNRARLRNYLNRNNLDSSNSLNGRSPINYDPDN